MRNQHNPGIIRSQSSPIHEARIYRGSETAYGPNGIRNTRLPLRSHGQEVEFQGSGASSSVHVAIQERVEFPTREGMVSAQRVRIVRIKQADFAPSEALNPVSRLGKQTDSFPNCTSRHPSSSQSELAGCWIDGRDMNLRKVGKIAVDKKGNIYEIREGQPRLLGDLVRDEQGRMFELLARDEIPKTGQEMEQTKGRSDSEPLGKHPESRAKSYRTDASTRETQANPFRSATPGEKQPESRKPTQESLSVHQKTRHAHLNAKVNGSRTAQAEGRKPQTLDSSSAHPAAEKQNVSHAASAHPNAQIPIPKCEIPHEYMDPLQFRYSREEVLYDMKSMFGTLPPEAGILSRWLIIYPLRRLRTVTASISSRRSIKKWRAMLKGRSPEDQLWSVSPPRGFYCLLDIRDWAEERLEWAGYDPNRMLLEWEIFWRRKDAR